MDTAALYFCCDEDEEEDNLNNMRIRRNVLRNESCPLDIPEKKFRRLFRLSKESFKYLLDQTNPKFRPTKCKSAIPPILKLAATLRFLAEGSYQQSVGQDYLVGMAQPTVSMVMWEVVNILESFCGDYINFDQTEEEQKKCKQYYYVKRGFPGIISCIDGTHVNIIKPTKNEHHFYNRKGRHSINVMAKCNHNLLITSVVANHGGCSHDSSVWSTSLERQYLETKFRTRNKSAWLLGDSGYPLEPWLMTPYKNALDGTNEAKYNEIHSKCRTTIERCFGVIKGRFRCLLGARELHYKPEKAAQIINVSCMLHNICIKYNVEFDETLFVNDEAFENVGNTTTSNTLSEAKRIRDEIRNGLNSSLVYL